MQSVVESLAKGRLEEVEREGERVDEGLRGEVAAGKAAAAAGGKEGGKRYVCIRGVGLGRSRDTVDC